MARERTLADLLASFDKQVTRNRGNTSFPDHRKRGASSRKNRLDLRSPVSRPSRPSFTRPHNLDNSDPYLESGSSKKRAMRRWESDEDSEQDTNRYTQNRKQATQEAPDDLQSEDKDSDSEQDEHESSPPREIQKKAPVAKSSSQSISTPCRDSHSSTFHFTISTPAACDSHMSEIRPKPKTQTNEKPTKRADRQAQELESVSEEIKRMERQIIQELEVLKGELGEAFGLDEANSSSDVDDSDRAPQSKEDISTGRRENQTANGLPGPSTFVNRRAHTKRAPHPCSSSPRSEYISPTTTIKSPKMIYTITVPLVRQLLGLAEKRHNKQWANIGATIRKLRDRTELDYRSTYSKQSPAKRMELIRAIEDAIPELKIFEDSWAADFLANTTFRAKKGHMIKYWI